MNSQNLVEQTFCWALYAEVLYQCIPEFDDFECAVGKSEEEAIRPYLKEIGLERSHPMFSSFLDAGKELSLTLRELKEKCAKVEDRFPKITDLSEEAWCMAIRTRLTPLLEELRDTSYVY